MALEAKYTHLAALYDISHTSDDLIVDYAAKGEPQFDKWLDAVSSPLQMGSKSKNKAQQRKAETCSFDPDSGSTAGFFKPGGGQAHQLRCDFIRDILLQLRALGSASSERINHVSSWTQLCLLLDRLLAELEFGGPGMYVSDPSCPQGVRLRNRLHSVTSSWR